MLLNRVHNITITVKGVAIEQVSSATYLGVQLSTAFRGPRSRVSSQALARLRSSLGALNMIKGHCRNMGIS